MNDHYFISADEACVTNLSWWGVDQDGYVAMLASGGARIPKVLTWTNVEKLYNYFFKDAPVVSEATDDLRYWSLFPSSVAWEYQMKRQDSSYSNEAISVASKGAYLYEGALTDPCDIHYYRAMLPSKPILFRQLPIEIQRCFEGKPLPISFAKTEIFEDMVIPNHI